MTVFTDTELMRQWVSLRDRSASIHGKYDRASKKLRAQLREEERTIRINWNQLISAKREGKLTDADYVEMVTKAARSLALQYLLRVELENEAGPPDSSGFPNHWAVTAHPIGEASLAKLKAYADAVANEEDVKEVEALTMPPMVESDAARGMRVRWCVDNWIWNGPENNRGLVSLNPK